MLVFPEVQAKAQSEIDRVIGSSRLPTIDDEKDLQYIRAIVKESLRWMPTAMLGAFPHAATQDNEYNGYKIPKGAWVILNTYGIHMDPARYPNPRTFDPDRYIDDFLNSNDSAVSPDAAKRDHFVFGAGRRICPGMNVADTSLFLGIARLLWGFNIRPMKDLDGNDIIPDTNQYTQGIVCMPAEYQADIRPRSDKRAEIIRKEWREAEGLLDEATKQWKEVPEGMPFSVA
jgi:cytochrome P450